MNKKRFNKKLSLNKMAISNLNNKAKSNVYGGFGDSFDVVECPIGPPDDTYDVTCPPRDN